MKKKQPLIDGFIPRRIGGQLGDRHGDKEITSEESMQRPLHTGGESRQSLGQVNRSLSASESELEESLKEIDDSKDDDKPKKKTLKDFLKRPPKPGRKKRIIKWTLLSVLVLVLAGGAYFAYRVLFASGNVFEGSIFDIVQSQPLKEDVNGRSNFLVIGTSEDDPGHGGAWLTDSMMVVSMNQTKKDVFMFSIPRDLYVDYGRACNSGYSGKINEYFLCVNADIESKKAEEERLTELRKFVGDIFGFDIQYAVHVNNKVIKDSVNAVDGIDVDIQGSNGAPGILDRNFDWRCNYTCYLVNYENGVHHLDGEHALFLAMARGDVRPTYGLGNSNFDREKNQQKIIIALRDKAISSGTLTNVSKVTGLIDALGNNLRTNIAVKEIRTLIDLASSIDPGDIHTISLVDPDNRVVTSGNYNGASVVMPVAGIFNYTDIQSYIKKIIKSSPAVLEAATLSVLNGSTTLGLATSEAAKLTEKDLKVEEIGDAPKGKYEQYEIYVINKEKTATVKELESLYGVSAKETAPTFNVTEGIDIVIVVGPVPANQ